jgi:hypothetical protein
MSLPSAERVREHRPRVSGSVNLHPILDHDSCFLREVGVTRVAVLRLDRPGLRVPRPLDVYAAVRQVDVRPVESDELAQAEP